VLNPSWYVPKSIASKEIRPKGRSYLRRNGFEVLPDGRLRQKPGPNNSLGQVKFRFPNRFGVYLHDTQARSLFDRAARALSHGCVRVERPEDLAAWVLRDAPGWSEDAILDALDSGRERLVELPEPIPVHIVYWTAWVDDAGTLRFAPDIYDQDRDVLVSRGTTRAAPGP
jgi:L,D-transpeptidase YcbB